MRLPDVRPVCGVGGVVERGRVAIALNTLTTRVGESLCRWVLGREKSIAKVTNGCFHISSTFPFCVFFFFPIIIFIPLRIIFFTFIILQQSGYSPPAASTFSGSKMGKQGKERHTHTPGQRGVGQ